MMITTLPLLCMVMTIVPARIFNQQRDVQAQGASASERLAALQAQDINNTQVAHEIGVFLHNYQNTYKHGGMPSLEALTYPTSWKRWHADTRLQEQVTVHLKHFASWKEFTLGTPRQRPSGHVEVILCHNAKRLKVWLFLTKDGWRLEGVVSPPEWRVDIL